jgi:hypothetical protein
VKRAGSVAAAGIASVADIEGRDATRAYHWTRARRVCCTKGK